MSTKDGLDELYRRAVTLEGEERRAFLRAVAAEDEAAARRLTQRLTLALGLAEDTVADVGAAGRVVGSPARTTGDRLGAYRISRSLGRGGMGEVFLAERADGEFHGRVAIKVVRPGGGDDVLERFRAERQTLANLEHPNIARLLDAGTAEDGSPYLVMEYVDGVRIDRYCDDRGLGVEERLRIFLDVCSAVQHAHRNLVVHRDLKPDNILVNTRGEVKLLDFGIAKLLPGAVSEELAAETRTGHAAMSLHYASPEQFLGRPITTATDVYALGILLYRLLTGRHPYEAEGDSVVAVFRAATETIREPPSEVLQGRFAGQGPERLRRRLAGDLDNITLEALRKEPERRYPSVERLAEDVQRHLDGRPVRARPDTVGYRASKFLRRHKVAVAAAFALFLALAAGLGATLWQARIAERRAADVRELAGALIFEIDDLVRDLPGSTPARQRIVARALAYLDRLAADSAGDSGLRRELAVAYQRVGNIQGNPSVSNLGDTRGALASYHKGLALAEDVVRRDPTDSEAIRSLAVIHEKLADVQAWTGDLTAAERHAALALQLFESLAEAHPGELRHCFSLAISLVKAGDLAGHPSFPNRGRPDEALGSYRRAAALLDELAAAHPREVSVRRYRGLVGERLGTVLLSTGDLQGADAAYRESFALRRTLAAELPGNTEAQRDVAVALEKLADVLLAAGRAREALDRLAPSFAIFRDLAAADPRNASARRSLAISHQKMAAANELLGRAAAATTELRASREILAALVAADPANAQLRADLAEVDERLAESSKPG